jgi:hypothetical protein
VYSADTFSKHYCQRRASVPPWILMATFHMKAIWNMENMNVILFCLPWIVTWPFPVNHFYSIITVSSRFVNSTGILTDW